MNFSHSNQRLCMIFDLVGLKVIPGEAGFRTDFFQI